MADLVLLKILAERARDIVEDAFPDEYADFFTADYIERNPKQAQEYLEESYEDCGDMELLEIAYHIRNQFSQKEETEKPKRKLKKRSIREEKFKEFRKRRMQKGVEK